MDNNSIAIDRVYNPDIFQLYIYCGVKSGFFKCI